MSSWQMFFFGGGKCPNVGVVNVRILGVVNVLLANDSQSCWAMGLLINDPITREGKLLGRDMVIKWSNRQALDRKLVEELIWGEWGSQIIKS